MRRVLLIARREYRQHLRTRGFWIGLLLIPVVMVASTLLPLLLENEKGGDALLFADPSGRFQPAIERALERDYQKSLPPPRALVLVPFPEWISPGEPKPVLDTLIPPYLQSEPKIATEDGPRRVVAAAILPETFDPGKGWDIWTNGSVGGGIIQLVAETIERQIRDDALRTAGFDAEAELFETGRIAPHVHSPPRRNAVSTDTVRQLIPVASAWMLWMTIMLVSNVLLHGLIEERSNKLIESLLATVSAHELMSGKLIGVAGVGFTIAATWTVFAIASVGFAPADMALVLRPALEPYASVATVFGLVFYFVTGYLAIATLFLVIGSMCDSMHDAQAYMTPLIVILLAPLVLVRPALSDPHGLLPVIMSWIPIYTPFVMLARLGTGISIFEVGSSSVLLVGFIAVELLVAGRIFRASLLRTGQPPRLLALLRLCFAGRAR
jgi:ABC-2 type transport system permease protein